MLEMAWTTVDWLQSRHSIHPSIHPFIHAAFRLSIHSSIYPNWLPHTKIPASLYILISNVDHVKYEIMIK